MRARRGRGCGCVVDQAGPPLPRRDRRRAGSLRLADLRVQRERRVRDGEGGGRARLAGRTAGGAREPRCDQAGRRRRDRHVLGEGGRRVALSRAFADRKSSTLMRRARSVIPGGVNSPVRAWRAMGAEPFFVARAEGAYLEDTDGRRYVDWVMSWGPLVFGHADPEVVEAVQEAAAEGTTFGAPTEREVELAEEIADAVPSVEKVRLVSSGTEAAMSAIRLARAFTDRGAIVKFA